MAGNDIEILPPDPQWQAPHANPPTVYDTGPAEVPPAHGVRAASPPGDPRLVSRLIARAAKIVAFSLVALFVLWVLEPFGAHPLTQAAEWLRDAGPWGRVLVVVVMALTVPFLVPITPAAMLPGYLWGPAEGVVVTLAGASLGGLLNFTLGRRLLQRHVEAWAARNVLVRSLIGTINARGFRILIGMRISPVMSYGLLSYLSGLTSISPIRFVVAMVLGGVPWTLVWAMTGALAQQSSVELGDAQLAAGPEVIALRWLGLAITVAMAVWIGRLARRDFQKTRADMTAS